MTDSTLAIIDGAGDTKYVKGQGAGTAEDPFIPYHVAQDVVMDETNFVCEYLVNGSSPALNVDGTTPVTFSAKPPAGYYWMVTHLELFLSDTNALEAALFGNETALTNGLSIKANNVEILNLKDNADCQLAFGAHGGADLYKNADKAMFVSSDLAGADSGQHRGLKVLETYGLSAVVQDNLSGLLLTRLRLHGKQFAV